MSIKKMIDKIVSPRLLDLGFLYEGEEHGTWNYIRIVYDKPQQITFTKSFHRERSIKVTYNCGDQSKTGSNLVKHDSWWTYTDTNSLEKALQELLQITIEHGIPWMNMESDPEVVPTEKEYEKLMQDPEGRAKRFAEKFRLSLDNPKDLKQLECLLMERKSQSEDVDWEFMINSAAFFGELIRNIYGGEWVLDEGEFRLTRVAGILETLTTLPKEAINPLTRVALFWSKPNLQRTGLGHLFEFIEYVIKNS